MNLNEFNALKPGDRIENAMSNSSGEVVEADSKGVNVRWSGEQGAANNGATRHYSRFSTIWFHWSKVEAQHKSDCAVNNGPALPAGPCDCGATEQ